MACTEKMGLQSELDVDQIIDTRKEGMFTILHFMDWFGYKSNRCLSKIDLYECPFSLGLLYRNLFVIVLLIIAGNLHRSIICSWYTISITFACNLNRKQSISEESLLFIYGIPPLS